MELRTLRRNETGAWLELLGGPGLADGGRGRERIARILEVDPRFDPKQVWVAAEGDRLVASVQLVPRRMRLLGHSVPCGGIGSIFTRADRRGAGIASRLLARAVEELRGAAVEIALAFAPERGARPYEALGFGRWQQERVVVAAGPEPARGEREAGGGASLEDFDAARDLESVVAIHSAYSAARSGTLVRDATAWQVSLVLAGNPDERFRVALRGGRPVAYLRSARLGDRACALEIARLDDAADALAALVVDAIATPEEGLVLPTFDDLALTVALEHAGHACVPETVETAMLCCLDAAALGARLHIGRLPGEDASAFLRRILPPDAFTFWPSDRF